MTTPSGSAANVLVATQARIGREFAGRSPATIVVEPRSARIVPTARRTRARIVLVDVKLPGLDGPKILRELTKVSPAPDVIFTHAIDESLRQTLTARRRRSPERRAVASLLKVLEQLELTPADMRHLADAVSVETASPRSRAERTAARHLARSPALKRFLAGQSFLNHSIFSKFPQSFF